MSSTAGHSKVCRRGRGGESGMAGDCLNGGVESRSNDRTKGVYGVRRGGSGEPE